MRKNYDAFDLLKFILSILVLAIHTFFLMDSIYPWARMTIPAYLILTGFFLFNKLDSLQTETEKRKAIAKTIRRYLLLYALWLIIHLPVIDWTWFGYGRVSNRHFVFNVFHHFFLSETFRGSWYLMACILGVPIVYFLFYKLPKRMVYAVVMLVYVLVSLYSILGGLLQRTPLGMQVNRVIEGILLDPETTFLIALPYLTLGKIIAEGKDRLRSKGFYLIGLLVCLVLLYAEYTTLQKWKIGGFTRTCYMMLLPASFFFVPLVMKLDLHLKHARFFRMASTIIYFLHIPVMELVYVTVILGNVLPMDDQSIMFTLLTALPCIAVASLINWMEKKKPFRFLRYLH